jgi:hypothetical protein
MTKNEEKALKAANVAYDGAVLRYQGDIRFFPKSHQILDWFRKNIKDGRMGLVKPKLT